MGYELESVCFFLLSGSCLTLASVAKGVVAKVVESELAFDPPLTICYKRFVPAAPGRCLNLMVNRLLKRSTSGVWSVPPLPSAQESRNLSIFDLGCELYDGACRRKRARAQGPTEKTHPTACRNQTTDPGSNITRQFLSYV